VFATELGKLPSLEALLFLMEDLSKFHKQDLFLRKFQERSVPGAEGCLAFLAIGGHHVVVDPRKMEKAFSDFVLSQPITLSKTDFGPGKRVPTKIIRDVSRERRDVRFRILNFETQTSSQKVELFLSLIGEYKIPLEKVSGAEILGFRFFRIDDPARFKHALGLAEAMDLSLLNMSVTTRFRTRATVVRRKKNFQLNYPEQKISRRAFQVPITTTIHNFYLLLLHYLRSFPLGEPEKFYVKMIKTLLASTFSKHAEQEMPEGSELLTFGLFPPYTQIRLDNLFRGNRNGRVRFYFNALQAKALCAPVGKDMLFDAYVSHRASLCRPVPETIPRDEKIYNDLLAMGKEFGKLMQDNGFFDPNRTTMPNSRACVELSRKGGGNIGGLLKKAGRLVSFLGNPLLEVKEQNSERLEPLVIGLFGPPGCGKSTRVRQLVSYLKPFFPEVSEEDLFYSRSCNSAYWDGYRGQPITILDDFGQEVVNRLDVQEFVNLVSTNPFRLNMAALSEKGTFFRSPVIILTSNCQFGSVFRNSSGKRVVEDSLAVWRRVTLPYLVCPDGSLLKYRIQIRPEMYEQWREDKYERYIPEGFVSPDSLSLGPDPSQVLRPVTGKTGSFAYAHDPGPHPNWFEDGERMTFAQLKESIQETLQKRLAVHEQSIAGTWTQVVSRHRVEFLQDGSLIQPIVEPIPFPLDKRDHTIALQFPTSPPLDPPRVKPIALPEELKVRMITAAECDTKCLQPLQIALWRTLSLLPECCLTNGVKDLESFTGETLPWIERIEKVIQRILSCSTSDEFWLSGDYTNATDNLPLWVTEALLTGILCFIDHYPTKAWALWEISPHRILYQEEHGGPATQTSGQLMGSLLSFPLLCLANLYTLRSAGFLSHQMLVNGDDVVARGTLDQIARWRDIAPRIGLSLSVGKNFIDPDFCTVNSQLFIEGDVQHTGKVSCQKRQGTTIGYCFQEAQYYWGPGDKVKWDFIRRNLNELRKTPRSLDIPVSLGGLALYENFSRLEGTHDRALFKKVYFFDLLRKLIKPEHWKDEQTGEKIAILSFPVFYGAVPQIMKNKDGEKKDRSYERLSSLRFPSKKAESEFQEDLSSPELVEFWNAVKKSPGGGRLKQIVQSSSYLLETFPPLNSFGTRRVFIRKGSEMKFQQEILSSFLRWFDTELLPSNTQFEYFDWDCTELYTLNQREKFSRLVLPELLCQPGVGNTFPEFRERPSVGPTSLFYRGSMALFAKQLRVLSNGETVPGFHDRFSRPCGEEVRSLRDLLDRQGLISSIPVSVM
jgi:hypothetical protein